MRCSDNVGNEQSTLLSSLSSSSCYRRKEPTHAARRRRIRCIRPLGVLMNTITDLSIHAQVVWPLLLIPLLPRGIIPSTRGGRRIPYLFSGWAGMIDAHDISASNWIGGEVQDNGGFGSVRDGEIAKCCSKRHGRGLGGVSRLLGEGKGHWRDRGGSSAGIHLSIVLKNQELRLPRTPL